MNDTTTTPGPPWHFRAVGIAGLLLNGFGAYDYVLAQMRDPEYLSQVPPQMAAYLDSFPMWSTAAWAIGVWGSLLGSILLLLRSRHAAPVFLVAWLSTAATYAYHYIVGVPPTIDTPAINTLKVAILALIAFFWWYARKQTMAGVLR